MVIGLVGGSLGILIVALAPNIPVVLVGWRIAQLFFNGLLTAVVGGDAGSDPRRSTRPGLRSSGCLSAHCVGERHIPGSTVHRNQLAMFHQIFLGTLVQSTFVVAASLIGGKLSDRMARRKIFVLSASTP
jgi:hypothetical protein